MKIIVSHDIDHFNWSDHLLKDLYIPKYLLKNTFFLLRARISLDIYLARIRSFSTNRLNRLEELIEFNKVNEVPATFFMGVRNALNLSYDLKTASKIAEQLRKLNIPLFIHGISFDDVPKMEAEKADFEKILGDASGMGIRMHYLRNSERTLRNLDELGYRFDSTVYDLKDPYFVGKMIEFPVSMMEVYEMSYDETDFEKVRDRSLARIKSAEEKSLSYFTVIFHDHHFSESFPLHKKWYEWLIDHFKSNQYEFIDFKSAIAEIKAK